MKRWIFLARFGGKMYSKVFGLLFAIVFVIILPLLAVNTHSSGRPAISAIEGKLVCMACELKAGEGARSACNEFGHNYGLKTADGRYLSFLENRYSKDLIAGENYGEKEIVIHGYFHKAANLIDVESFEVDGQKISWCAHCRTMDGCGARN